MRFIIDVHTILLARSIFVAGFVVISIVSTIGLLYLNENGITASLMACTFAMALLSGAIFYTGIVTTITLSDAAIRSNYWNWVIETIAWGGLCAVHIWLGYMLIRHRKRNNEPAI